MKIPIFVSQRYAMKVGIIIILCLFCFSCSKSEYPGYKKVRKDMYYKLYMFGEETETPKPGDYITVNLAYQTMSDSVFFSGKRTLQLEEPAFDGCIEECFMMLAEGDSAGFIISADALFEKTLNTSLPTFIPENSRMKVGAHLIAFRTEEDYNREKEEFLAWIKDFGDYEKTVLKHFIEEQEIDIEPTSSGMYYIPVIEGNGKKVEIGDIITVNYEGKFLNGRFFDSTIKRKQPFEFVYGTEWQVIQGLEEAIGMMREGDKAIVILPSGLAWGQDGSKTGIVPPFTSVIYEVELVKVRTREDHV